MVKEIDFWEVYVYSKNGQAMARKRKKLFESKGHEVIPYEDKWIDKNGKTRWVSVGIYVLKKEGEPDEQHVCQHNETCHCKVEAKTT